MNRRILLPTLLLGALGLGALNIAQEPRCAFISYEELGSAAPVDTSSPAWENGGECR